MKRYGILAFLGFLVLGAAAVWLGGLNQDEGWYLYAANLVSEGQMPYRDFAFTQGPIMPILYSAASPIWKSFGLLGARVFTLGLGFFGIILATALAYRLSRSKAAALVTFMLLALNLYHLYYLAIPKTYALAAIFVLLGFFFLSFENAMAVYIAAFAFSFAAATRFSLAAIMPVICFAFFWTRSWGRLTCFVLGAVGGLALAFAPAYLDPLSRAGFMEALSYHAARKGFDPVFTIGSLSRLVRWYLPIFVLFAFGFTRIPKGLPRVMLLSFFTVFVLQLAAPFPYEDYQVPIMALLAVVAAVSVTRESASSVFLTFLLVCASSFGSPLLETWTTNGKDRFWPLKKDKTELAALRDVARRIETLDPGGKTLLTQDLYLAIETNRKVPHGLEMGPFADLSPEEWEKLLSSADESCAVAALSGYSFAIVPPACTERPLGEQLHFWSLLESAYEPAFRVDFFGQGATSLLILKRK